MENLLWSGLTIVVGLSLVFFFFRVAKLIKQHLGLGAMLIFGLGLLVLGCRPTATPAPANGNLLTTIPPGTPLGNASSLRTIPLGGGLKLQLLAEYHQAAGVIRPRGLFVNVSGLLIGHTWQPLTGHLQPMGQQLHYSVVMKHDWQLLSLPVFSSVTEFTGTMPLGATL